MENSIAGDYLEQRFVLAEAKKGYRLALAAGHVDISATAVSR